MVDARLVLTGLLLLAACAEEPAEVPPSSSPDAPAASAHHFTVDSARYTLTREGAALRTSIGYAFRNRLPDTIYVVNCNGHVVMDLQKREGTAWRTVLPGMTNACLSPALEIAPGDSIAGRWVVWGALPGDPSLPTYETDELEGEFRLIWHQPRLNYAGDVRNFGDTLAVAERTSMPFELRRADDESVASGAGNGYE